MKIGDNSDDEDAAERNNRDRMRAIYARVNDIDAQRHALAQEKAKLLLEVCESIGINPGVVLDNVRGGKAQVVTCHGDFDIGYDGKPGGPYTVYPSATCQVAPATADGFHSRTRIRHLYLDKKSAFMAQNGHPLLDCPQCGAPMLYEDGEPLDGSERSCHECGHTLPEKQTSTT